MRVGGLFTGIGAHHEVVKSIPGLGIPRTVLYKMAGNSICVAPLRKITECALSPSHDQTIMDYWM